MPEFAQDLRGCSIDARLLFLVDLAPGAYGSLANCLVWIDEQTWIELDLGAQAITLRAHAMGRVEAEHLGREFGETDSADWAGVLF